MVPYGEIVPREPDTLVKILAISNAENGNKDAEVHDLPSLQLLWEPQQARGLREVILKSIVHPTS
jgi:hypothetical protein